MATGRAHTVMVLERIVPPRPLDEVARLRRGSGDPTHRRDGTDWWRAANTPEGPVLLAIRGSRTEVRGYAWGAGARWALDQLPELLGATDDPGDFRPEHPLLTEAWRRNPWLRVGRTRLVLESLVPAVIEQKVTGAEAFRAQRLLIRRYGTPAPGPASDPQSPAYGMFCPPTADQWAAIPSWAWLKAGVEQKRSRTAVGAARRSAALEHTLQRADANTALQSLPGIGAWTSAEVRQRAHGDPDAWSTGDYHIPGMITLALLGEVLDNDAAEEVLEPYRGHRYRVQQLIAIAGPRAERHGPRHSGPSHLP